MSPSNQLRPPQVQTIEWFIRPSTILLITFFLIQTQLNLLEAQGRNLFTQTSTSQLNPLVFQKYSLLMSPSSSVVGTNAASANLVSPTEQLLSYVPAPMGARNTLAISTLPIMPALASTGSLAASALNLPTPGQSEVPVSYKFELPDSFSGALEPNNLLAGATRMFEGQIVGPTSLAIHKDFIYAGTSGGAVWRGNLRTGNATRIAKINNDACEKKPWDSSLCGRPLGVRVDKQGVLYFVDAYLGLHSIHFDADDRVQLTPLLSVEQVGGKYMGHLVLDEGAGSNGGHMIYITIASAKRDLTQWTAMVIEPDTTGFVVQYDTGSGQFAIIWDKLWYPTSIEITDDRSAILVAEFSSRKVLKYFIKGPKKGTSEVWVENLPGESDHLIRSADKTKETYWMPIVNARNQSKPNLLDFMSDKPYLRKEILDQYFAIGSRLEQLGQEYGSEQLEKLGFEMKTSFQFYRTQIGNNYGLILELDANGNILGSLHSTNGVNSFISEALEGESDSPLERILYIGSFGYPYILRLAIRKPAADLASSLMAGGSARSLLLNNDPMSLAGSTTSRTTIGYSPIINPTNTSPLWQALNSTNLPTSILNTWSQFHRIAPFVVSRQK